MRNGLSFLILIALLWVPAAVASNITLESVNGNNDGQYYTGFVSLSNADDGTNIVFEALCFDFDHGISTGDTWDAQIIPLLSMPSAEIPKWRQVAWLYIQLENITNSQTISDIQYAVWRIFASDPSKVPNNGDSSNWSVLAQTNGSSLSTGVLATFSVIEPTRAGAGQGFIAQNVPSENPEPATLLLLGGGLLGLGIMRHRRTSRR